MLPVYVVAGEERLLRDEVVAELRAASLAGGVAAFNEDKFTAGEANVEAVIAAARTVPMMAPRRFVLLRGAERWDASEDGDGTAGGPTRSGEAASAFDRLAEYAAAPVDSTCLVMVASKLDRRRKLALVAKKNDFLVVCDPLDSRSLPRWIVDRCASKGHAIDPDVADLLAALAGPQLSSIDDAIERLSLYVGSERSARRKRHRGVRCAGAVGRYMGARRRRGRARSRSVPANARRRVRSARSRAPAPRGARLVDPAVGTLPGGRCRGGRSGHRRQEGGGLHGASGA